VHRPPAEPNGAAFVGGHLEDRGSGRAGAFRSQSFKGMPVNGKLPGGHIAIAAYFKMELEIAPQHRSLISKRWNVCSLLSLTV